MKIRVKETYYFSHDYNARNDPKLQHLQSEMGQEGKGIYWDIVEMLYENDGTLEMTIKALTFALRVEEEEKVKRVLYDFGLFETNGESFTSLSVQRRIKKRDEISEKRREAAKAKHQKHSGKHMQSKSNANAKQKPAIKLNEIKLKEKKEEENKSTYSKSEPEEVLKLFQKICKSYPKIRKLSEVRITHIKARLRNNSFEEIKEAFRKAEASDFMKGDNKKGWKADFDWIMSSQNNFIKVLEGKYDNQNESDLEYFGDAQMRAQRRKL